MYTMQQFVHFTPETSKDDVNREMEPRRDLPIFLGYLAILALLSVVLLSKIAKGNLNLLVA
jgi:uncharacterized membrane protein